jgi:hypothetical protein
MLRYHPGNLVFLYLVHYSFAENFLRSSLHVFGPGDHESKEQI